MHALLLAVFVLSGAAGLIYESIWSRYLGLFVGHGAYAQLIVLGVFLGGMAGGAALAARRAERIGRPLRAYAYVEVAVGLIGLAFHRVFGVVTEAAYTGLFPALDGPLLVVAKWGIAALLILPQSLLLGATFPLMSAGALRLDARAGGRAPGRRLAQLYAANSLGAALGVLVAGFVLVQLAGLPGTLAAAAITNFVVALLVLLVARDVAEGATHPMLQRTDAASTATSADTAGSDAPPAAPAPSGLLADPRLPRALLVIAGGTAVASFIYEIAWIRMLALVLGSATHAFELMLSAFILGLALGAWWMRRRADSFADPVRALVVIQWTMGVLALATIPLYLASFGLLADALDALSRTPNAYRVFTLLRYGLCLLVMLPATFCAGMTLPLITRLLLGAGQGERAIGTVYAVNTVGSIIGASVAGLLLLPWLGLKGTLLLGGAMDMALGVWLLWRFAPRISAGARLLRITALGGAAVVTSIAMTQRFDPGVLTSGVYRYGRAPAPGDRPVEFLKDGRTATVSLRRDRNGTLSLATNGKPDASLTPAWMTPPDPTAPRTALGGDQVTQALLPLITLAHAPRAERVAVIGVGSGVSSHLLLGSPHAREVVTLEIEPAIVEAASRFRPANERLYTDPRSRIVYDDAKAYFAAADTTFDLILSEPSNPWVSGVSGLFTDEFYARVTQYLAPGGVFGQWLHLYEINDELVSTVLAALHKHFPAYEVFYTSNVDLLIVATNGASLPAPDWGVVAYPEVARDLAPFRALTADALEATRLTGRRALAPLLDGATTVNSDYYPVLDLGAERARFLGGQAVGTLAMGADRFPLGLVLAGHRHGFSADHEAPLDIARVEQRAIAAWLRGGAALDDTTAEYEPVRRLRMAEASLAALRATTMAPPHWEAWLADVLRADDARHGGSAGVADSAWYDALLTYTAQQGAPERVDHMLRFLRAARSWDWPAVITHGERLVALGTVRPVAPVPTDLLRDALVVAYLRTGDVATARRVHDLLGKGSGRPADDLRVRLLAAWVAASEARTAPAAAGDATTRGAAPGR
jgi:spermidine synthase